jgi:hypothetical protein
MGTVLAIRRAGGARRVEVDIPQAGRVEVQAAGSGAPRPGETIGITIERARVFP